MHKGFIVKKVPLKEKDEIITIFTQDSGKIDVYAFGSRAQKSKKKSLLEIFNLLEFSTKKPKSANFLYTLSEIKLELDKRELKVNNFQLFCLFLLAETINNVLQLEEIDQELFNWLVQMKQPQEILGIVLNILYKHGFVSDLSLDVETGEKLNLEHKIIRSSDKPGYKNLEIEAISTELVREIKSLNFFLKTSFEHWQLLEIEEVQLKQLFKILVNWLEMIVEREFKSKYLLT